MSVNGIELKEGQIWLDDEGNQRTLSKRNHPIYMWVGIRDDGDRVTYTCDGKYYDGHSSVIDLITLVSEKEDTMTKKFTPQPGDKIICNNGEEFICCTLEFLRETIYEGIKSDKPILGYRKFGYDEEWMDWDEEDLSCPEEYGIREVIPQNAESSADKEEEVKEEPRYTVEEVFYAIKEHCGKYDSPLGCEFEIKNLLKRFDEDPKYKEYLRLKAIYE